MPTQADTDFQALEQDIAAFAIFSKSLAQGDLTQRGLSL